MIDASITGLVIVPAGLGLIGFVEPCSIGSSLVFVKYLEGRNGTAKVVETTLFALTRATFIGLLGASAALIGALFLDLQRGGWLLLGGAYVALGLLVATGRARALMVTIGPGLRTLSGPRASAGLGLLFGLNIPACAAPLLFALLAGSATAPGMTLLSGFVALAIFGFALSLPLVAIVSIPAARASRPTRRAVRPFSHHCRRRPRRPRRLVNLVRPVRDHRPGCASQLKGYSS